VTRQNLWLSALLLLLGLVVGSGITYAIAGTDDSSTKDQVRQMQKELADLKAATGRAVIPIEPGEGDNAPIVWTGQTGRIRYLQASSVGFDYIVEIENMPPNKTWHNFFAIAPTGQNPLEHIKKSGEVKTDAFGRGTLSGVIPYTPGKYILGHFLTDKDDPNPPFTHRTYLCIRTSASFEVVSRDS
jgi:hypothetical protein